MMHKTVILVLVFICVVILIAWPLSYRADIGCSYRPHNRDTATMSGKDAFSMGFASGRVVLTRMQQVKRYTTPASLKWGPVEYRREETDGTLNVQRTQTISVSAWLLLIVIGVYPAIEFIRGPLRRRRRRRKGLCTSCSYDLTGNMSGVCPECGEETRRGENA
ncbi:MAG: hypothetical protein JSU63_07220 [Phycisphaerales bacterium]|nr:MAG: hypothetical protein JSU63_07220 [Phycisphaerales bacterium]